MEPSWGGFYNNYYPQQQDPARPYDRAPPNASASSTNELSSPNDDQSQRRNMTQGPPFLPPTPVPHGSQHGHLPPFSHSFYSSNHPFSSTSLHSPSGPGLGLSGSFGSSSSNTPPNTGGFASSKHHTPGGSHGPGGYGNHSGPHQVGGGPSQLSPSTTNSGSLSRGLPHPRGPHSYSESPRLQGAPLSYSSSPGLHHVSPTSPTTHLLQPGMFGSGNNSSNSSMFPSGASKTPGSGPKRKARLGNGSPSGESWDDSDKSGRPVIGEETDEQPWGMPQDQYKSLNHRDKKQVRNRIGPGRFRAKRKDYVSNLEGSVRARDDELTNLRNQVDNYRSQINDLRSRLGMALLSPQLSNTSSTPGLGLLVPQDESDGWDAKDDL